jgi:ribA/ribD-fused uncharacterized protein
MDKVINFNRVSDQYGEFSNFAPFKINIMGKVWPTSEHYFQAQKCDDPFYQKEILQATTPKMAAELGRRLDLKIRDNWEQIKDDVMYEALSAKFTQHQNLKELLLSTDNAIIVEHTSRDDYWGDGGDGSGKNMLGKTLMKVREELKGETTFL